MPDLPLRSRDRGVAARRRLAVALEWLIASAGAALLTAAVAGLLWLLKVEFQYVLGAFMIVFASRLSQKRLAPTVTVEEKRPTPVRDMVRGPRDPMGPLVP